MVKQKKKMMFHITENCSGREWFVMARDIGAAQETLEELCFLADEDLEFDCEKFDENNFVEVSVQLKTSKV